MPTPDPNLVFERAAPSSTDLVFGDVSDVPSSSFALDATLPLPTLAVQAIAGALVVLDATLPLPTVSVRFIPDRSFALDATLPLPTLDIVCIPSALFALDATLPLPTVAMDAVYNANVARPTVGQSAAAWQKAGAFEQGSQIGQEVAGALPVGWQDASAPGTPCPGGFEQRLPGVLVPDATHYGAPIQEGTYLSASASAQTQDGERSIRDFNVGRFQGGTPARHAARQGHQDGDRSKRGWRTVRHQEASRNPGRRYTGHPKSGTPYQFGRTTHWQDGMAPSAGISYWVVPLVPTVPPGDAALLFWDDDWSTGAALLFGKTAAIVPVLTLCILPARFYMAVHTLVAHRLPDLVEVPLFDASVASDVGSFCWTLQASGPSSLFTLLQPEGNVPVRLRVTLDGIAFVFAIDSLGRPSVFGKTGASISGRSATALIGAPYWRAGVFSNSEERTAQQLAVEALTNTGITLDWGSGAGVAANGGLVDWLVPAGAWSFQGTPLAAVQQIAQAAGGYLQSHRSAATLLTRHPCGTRALDAPGAPWGWSTGAADVELATDALITEAITRADGADINAVYVSGTTQGVLGLVKRAGSAADKLAAMVSDPLITEAVAARQRGLAILGAAGHKHSVRLDLPVLTGQGQPGILDVGQLVQVNTATPWRGRVRAVNVASNWPSLRQSVTIERHLEVA